jgi:hypothetical protein
MHALRLSSKDRRKKAPHLKFYDLPSPASQSQPSNPYFSNTTYVSRAAGGISARVSYLPISSDSTNTPSDPPLSQMDTGDVSFHNDQDDNDHNMEIEDVEPNINSKRKRTAGVLLFYSCTSVQLTQNWSGSSVVAMDTTTRHVLE